MSDERGLEHLDEVFQDGGFRIRASIGSGFDIWKMKAGSFIAFTLVVMLVGIILSLIPFLGQIGNSILVGPALTLGAYMYCNYVDRGRDVEFGNFLDGFKFLGTVAVARILISIVLLLLAILLFRNMFAGNWIDVLTGNTEFLTSSLMDEDFVLEEFINVDGLTMLFVIPLILFSMMIYYTECFIGFYGLNAMDAIRYSCQFVFKHLLKVIVFNILVGFIVASGILGIIIGVLITASMIYPIYYRSFAIMTRLDEFQDDMEDDDIRIEDSLVGE